MAQNGLAAIEESHIIPMIAQLEKAKMIIAKGSLRDVLELRSQAEAVKHYASKHRDYEAAAVQISEVSLRAARRAGEILAGMEKQNGGDATKARFQRETECPPRLSDLGVNKTASHRWQKISKIPDDTFEDFVAGCVNKNKQCTASAAYKLAPIDATSVKHGEAAEFDSGIVTSLSELGGQRFGTILADPPWKYGNQATRASTDNHYVTMSIDEICEMPISELAADDAQLHLWTTNGFLPDAFRVIESWGFSYRSCFVWCKPQLGIGNYWRVSHEFLLLGIRGSATFQDKTLKSWAEIPRGRHSAKPASVREMVELAGSGPRLELFGRISAPGWTVFGNQVERSLFA